MDTLPRASAIRAGVASAIGVASFGVGMAGFSLNPAMGVLLAGVGVAYVVASVVERRLARSWLVGMAIGFIASGVVYFGMAAYWIVFPLAPPSASGTGG